MTTTTTPNTLAHEHGARGTAPAFPHVESMERLLRLARLAEALQAMDSKLCWAVKNSRECGLTEMEQGLMGLQQQFDGLVARLQPAVFFKPQEPV